MNNSLRGAKLTRRAKMLQALLYLLTAIQLYLTYAKFSHEIVVLSDFPAIMILSFGTFRKNYRLLTVYLFLSFIAFFNNLNLLGTKIQNGVDLFSIGHHQTSKLILTSLIIDLISYYIVFESYKEFKAIFFQNENFAYDPISNSESPLPRPSHHETELTSRNAPVTVI